jgi:hypothetical protein
MDIYTSHNISISNRVYPEKIPYPTFLALFDHTLDIKALIAERLAGIVRSPGSAALRDRIVGIREKKSAVDLGGIYAPSSAIED